MHNNHYLINSTINTGQVSGVNTRAITKCKFMPANNIQVELVKVEIQAQIFVWLTQDTFIANAKQNTLTNGVDSAPGGLFDILALGAGFGFLTGSSKNFQTYFSDDRMLISSIVIEGE